MSCHLSLTMRVRINLGMEPGNGTWEWNMGDLLNTGACYSVMFQTPSTETMYIWPLELILVWACPTDDNCVLCNVVCTCKCEATVLAQTCYATQHL